MILQLRGIPVGLLLSLVVAQTIQRESENHRPSRRRLPNTPGRTGVCKGGSDFQETVPGTCRSQHVVRFSRVRCKIPKVWVQFR